MLIPFDEHSQVYLIIMELDMTMNGIASLCGAFLFLTTVTVFLRFLARYKQKAGFQIDDYVVAFACVNPLRLDSEL